MKDTIVEPGMGVVSPSELYTGFNHRFVPHNRIPQPATDTAMPVIDRLLKTANHAGNPRSPSLNYTKYSFCIVLHRNTGQGFGALALSNVYFLSELPAFTYFITAETKIIPTESAAARLNVYTAFSIKPC